MVGTVTSVLSFFPVYSTLIGAELKKGLMYVNISVEGVIGLYIDR